MVRNLAEGPNTSGRARTHPANFLQPLCTVPALRSMPLTSSPWTPHPLKDTQTNSSHGSSQRFPQSCRSASVSLKKLKHEVPSGSWWGGWQMSNPGSWLVPFANVCYFGCQPQIWSLSLTSHNFPILPQTTTRYHLPTSLFPVGLSLSLLVTLSQGWNQQASWEQRGFSGSWNPVGILSGSAGSPVEATLTSCYNLHAYVAPGFPTRGRLAPEQNCL